MNYGLIKLLRIPPIIATLCMSFIVQSTAIWSTGPADKPPPPGCLLPAALRHRKRGAGSAPDHHHRLDFLERSIYGRWITSIGQSMAAARIVSVPVDGARFLTYVICAFSSIISYLLASFSGGAALNMGRYLLVHCGRGDQRHLRGKRLSNVPGIWGASRHVPGGLDAEHLRARRRFPHDRDGHHHHCRDPPGQPPNTSLT